MRLEPVQVKVMLVDAEALVVGPDDRLIVKLSGELNRLRIGPDDPPPFNELLADELARIGLAGRSLVIAADGVEFAVVKKDATA